MPESETYAPLFSKERFDEERILVFVGLTLMSIFLFRLGFNYIAILPVVAAAIVFTVIATEKIKLEEPKQRQIVGRKCVVVKEVSKSEPGIVKLLNDRGDAEPETWSAELAKQGTLITGRTAKVTGRRTLFLIVEPD